MSTHQQTDEQIQLLICIRIRVFIQIHEFQFHLESGYAQDSFSKLATIKVFYVKHECVKIVLPLHRLKTDVFEFPTNIAAFQCECNLIS